LALFAMLWIFVFRIGDRGDGAGLPYLPVLNPLDLANLALFVVLWRWLRRLLPANSAWLYWLWGTAAFLALNLAIARTVHHLTGVDYRPEALVDSAVLQTTYAIFWGALALVLMFWSTRRKSRAVWLAGAVILALTVVKLFVIDLSNADTIARIISFIGVGLLVIVIAYFAPVPPAVETEPEVANVEAV
jgi:uncharacterized membrane protein